jgi:hypothetical protein
MHWSYVLMAVLLVASFWASPGPAASGRLSHSPLVVASRPPANCAAPVAGLRTSSSPTVQAAVDWDPSDAGIALDFCSRVSGAIGPYTLNWSFGDGTWSPLANPDHVYAEPANYTVVLTVNNSGTFATSTIYALVNATEQSTPTFTPTDPTTATAVNFSVAARLGVPPYTAFWKFGDNMTSTGLSVLHTYHAPGTYTVQVWTNDSGGGSVNDTFQVKVTAAPGQPTGGTDILIGTSVAAVAVAVGGYGYFQWDKKRRPKLPTARPPPKP